MADTLDNVTVPKGTWTNLYTGSGIAVGTAVTLINAGSAAVQIAIKATAPANNKIGIPLYDGPVGNVMVVSANETGLWAYSHNGVAYINVQE